MSVQTGFAVAGIVAVFIAACAVPSGRKTDFLPRHVDSVYIARFENQTEHEDLDTILADFLVESFQQKLPFRLVSDPALAELHVTGEIKHIFFHPLTYTQTGELDQARYYMQVFFSIIDVIEDEEFAFEERASAFEEVNLVTFPVADTSLVREELAKEIASQIVYYAQNGRPENINWMYGYEDRDADVGDGVLIGRERRNLDLNNDGMDDRLQLLEDTDGLTNYRAID